jgi:hypothetical protein
VHISTEASPIQADDVDVLHGVCRKKHSSMASHATPLRQQTIPDDQKLTLEMAQSS